MSKVSARVSNNVSKIWNKQTNNIMLLPNLDEFNICVIPSDTNASWLNAVYNDPMYKRGTISIGVLSCTNDESNASVGRFFDCIYINIFT